MLSHIFLVLLPLLSPHAAAAPIAPLQHHSVPIACTHWYRTRTGDTCASVVRMEPGMTPDRLAALNTKFDVDAVCRAGFFSPGAWLCLDIEVGAGQQQQSVKIGSSTETNPPATPEPSSSQTKTALATADASTAQPSSSSSTTGIVVSTVTVTARPSSSPSSTTGIVVYTVTVTAAPSSPTPTSPWTMTVTAAPPQTVTVQGRSAGPTCVMAPIYATMSGGRVFTAMPAVADGAPTPLPESSSAVEDAVVIVTVKDGRVFKMMTMEGEPAATTRALL